MKPHLYCMMEVGTREFLARCLTACVAAERGFTVLLGHQHTLMEHSTILPQGIYFSKGTNAIATANMAEALRHGHLTVACEEENFFRVLDNNPLDVTDHTLPDACTLFLAMGEEEETHLRNRFGAGIQIKRCGNARTDILRPELRTLFEQEAAILREQHGRFILINSNLGIINSAMPKNAPNDIFRNWVDANVFHEDLDLQQRGEIFQDFIRFDESNAMALRGVLSELAKRDYKVLFRPHPGEKKSTWEDIIRGLGAPHIEVMDEGSHIPVILASELLIHSSCTTGVEALLADKPSLSINTDQARAHSYYLSNQFNVRASSASESIAKALDKVSVDNHDQQVGVDIVHRALRMPLRQIAQNAGEDGAVVAGKVEEAKTATTGYDAQAGKYVDMVKAGIIDPTKVVRIALQDAASVAGLLITTEAMVAEIPEKKDPPMAPGGGMGDMGMGGMGMGM